MVALAFMPGKIYRGTTAAELRQVYPQADLLLESPEELSMAAALKSDSIFKLVCQFAPAIAERLAAGNKLFNNSRAWYKELSQVATHSPKPGSKPRPNITRGELNMTQNSGPVSDNPVSPEPITKERPARGPSFRYKDIAAKTICLSAEKNPKRPNTDAYKIFDLYFTHAPLTVESYLKLGARLRDIKCDVERGYITLKDATA